MDTTGQDLMCVGCGATTTQHPLGRSRLYCSATCRVRAHRAQRKLSPANKKDTAGVATAAPETVRYEQLTITDDTPTVTE